MNLRLLLLSSGVVGPLLAQEPPLPPRPALPPRAAAPVVTPQPAKPPAPPRPAKALAPLAPLADWPDDLDWIDGFAVDAMRARAEDAARAAEEMMAARADAVDAMITARATAPRAHVFGDADIWAATDLISTFPEAPLASRPRAAWAGADQGDSLYRHARELLNSGEYRRAAATFRDLATKTPNSAYAADALYWQAFALYRIGGNDELRAAVEALDQQKNRYPGARMRSESEALGVRIRGALASRGDAAAAAAIRTAAADSLLRCDREDQSIRAEALNAVVRSDPEGALPLLQKTLARKDPCSAPLRRTAVFLMGSRGGDAAVSALTQIARTDSSVEVRMAAIEWLARSGGDGALATLELLARDSADRIARTATRALVAHPSPRARAQVRALIERAETPERLRLEALSAFDRERSSAEDVAWMRALYARSENPRIRSRLVSTLSNIGGPEVDQWLLGLARDQELDSDTRRNALRRVGRTLPIPELAKLYDNSAERSVRDGVIDILRERPDAEATDKLIDIVKRGTDPQLRTRAINALTSKKDPRTIRLLMEIIDK